MKKIFICSSCGSMHYQDEFKCENCGADLDEAYEAQVSEEDSEKMMRDQLLASGS